MDHVSEMVDEFFSASNVEIATTHQEWLLRLCSQLMKREAEVVSVLERERRGKRKWKRSSPRLEGCTDLCTETGRR